MNCKSFSVVLLIVWVCAAGIHAENWPSFRGPRATGVSTLSSKTVDSWDVSTGKGVLWKIDLGGVAHSSPVIWGNNVYVSSVSGGQNWHDDSVKHTWMLYAFDKSTGKQLWKQVAAEATPRVGRHAKASQCNSTPVTDGRYVAAVMGPEGLFCYNTAGKLLWKKDLGMLNPGLANDESSQWGYASSPVIYKDSVIVQVDRHKNSFIAAFKLADGAQTWMVPRDELPGWSTPTIHEGKNRAEMITNGAHFVRSYDPLTGKELWRFADDAEVKQPTPFMANGLIIITGGYPRGRPIYALRTGASGDISKRENNKFIAWTIERGGPYTPTPLVHKDYLYTVQNNGVLGCFSMKDGSKVYENRLDGEYSASPVAAGDKIYFASEDGSVRVVQPGPEFKVLATNSMKEPLFATPAIADNVLFIRTTKTLYAVGNR